MIWMLVVPFVTMSTFYIIFSFFFPIAIEQYPLYLISGLIPWFFISFSVQHGVYVMANNGNLIKKIAFPRFLLPLSITCSNAITYLISMLILIIAAYALNYPIMLKKIVFLPVLFLLTTLFCASLAMILGYLYVFYRDLGPISELFIFILFYATPIFYNLDMIAKELHPFIYLNPVAVFIDLHHSVFLNAYAISPLKLCIVLFWTVLFLYLAKLVYTHKNPIIADYSKS